MCGHLTTSASRGRESRGTPLHVSDHERFRRALGERDMRHLSLGARTSELLRERGSDQGPHRCHGVVPDLHSGKSKGSRAQHIVSSRHSRDGWETTVLPRRLHVERKFGLANSEGWQRNAGTICRRTEAWPQWLCKRTTCDVCRGSRWLPPASPPPPVPVHARPHAMLKVMLKISRTPHRRDMCGCPPQHTLERSRIGVSYSQPGSN